MEKAPSLIFITGGVRSGKSSFAEKLAVQMARNTRARLHYIATGVPSDIEMKQRIQKHQRDRALETSVWRTLEQPTNIGELVCHFTKKDIILLDCITTLLNNELFSLEQSWDEFFLESIRERIESGIVDIKDQSKMLIVVSNEVLHEPMHNSHMVFQYQRILGKIHQSIVKEADQAYLVESGVPLLMKGVQT